MSFDYAGLAVTVQGVVADLGFTTQIRKTTDANAGGPEPDITTSDTDIKIVRDMNEIEGVDGRKNAVQDVIFVSTSGLTPAVDDLILLDGSWRRVMNVKPIKPGNVDLLFEVWLDG